MSTFSFRSPYVANKNMYLQKPLIKLMKSGAFPGEKGVPKHIETVISNVFLFDTKAYKFYKNDSELFNIGFRDISVKKERFSFTEKDFEWNNGVSPSIYTKLVGVKVLNGAIQIASSQNDAEELLIEMNRVDTENVLFEKLIRKDITKEHCFEIGVLLAKKLKVFQKNISGHTFYTLFGNRIEDLRQWITSIPECIQEEEVHTYLNFLDNFKKNNLNYFQNELTNEVTTDGDFHSLNCVYTEGALDLMDTYAPKDEWRMGHLHLPLYRIGADIWALSGKKEFFEAFVKGYETGSGRTVDRRLDAVFILYASAIMVSYLYQLQYADSSKKAHAEKYHAFLREYFKDNVDRA